MADGILIDHSRAQAFTENVATYINRMETVLTDLETELNAIANQWYGADKEVYDKVQLDWDAKVAELRLALGSHGQALGEVSGTYLNTNNNNAHMIGSITI
ncbi:MULTISPECIES: WXG100 family type VII secretion target [Streptomyces]|uniref:WXG100 family type VII secretion target n=1 Tax=Streptomyces TaxID=1883 RepID=UPI00240E1731|nr:MULTISPECIES: WXG100 family type VII secretion target [Streptomyces]WFB88505.1 WXG100 family type VII secretion target [Streptomyces olivaceus]WGK50947.1 WXG100 family type VII secretion target [Streptomyces sp. B146]